MSRTRAAIGRTHEGRQYVARFFHPLFERTIRVPLGDDPDHADELLAQLNGIFLNESRWEEPGDVDPDIRRAWIGSKSVAKTRPKKVKVRGESIPADEGSVTLTAHRLKQSLEREKGKDVRIRQLEGQIEKVLGRPTRSGPCPTLSIARDQFAATYTGRDDVHTKIVLLDLDRFIKTFGVETLVDDLAGREREIDSWLDGLTIERGSKRIGKRLGAGRRKAIRGHVLQFLRASGLNPDHKKIKMPERKDIRSDRGGIRWLEKADCEKLAKKMEEPWASVFRVQVALGLRPGELLTLKRGDFTADFSSLTLSPLDHLTLKLGPRTISVPEKTRALFAAAFAKQKVFLPDPLTGKPWAKAELFDRRYLERLRGAAKVLGADGNPIALESDDLDGRVGRRSCGGILLRAGSSVEQVAALLGDNPATIREHYANILPHEVDPSAAAI